MAFSYVFSLFFFWIFSTIATVFDFQRQSNINHQSTEHNINKKKKAIKKYNHNEHV